MRSAAVTDVSVLWCGLHASLPAQVCCCVSPAVTSTLLMLLCADKSYLQNDISFVLYVPDDKP